MDAKRKALTVFIGFTALAFLIFNANQAGPVSYKYTQPAMGTIFNVTVYGAPENDARDASRKAFSLLHSIEAELSRFRDDSELSAVNKLPASSHKISGHFLDCVKQSVAVGDLTDGYFDITFLPLYKAWDWRNDPKNEPSAATLEVLLKSVGYKKINLDEKGSTISLMPGMMLDLGGVAKGYSVVKMAESLKASGINDAIVNGGGDLVITSKRAYVIGLRSPFAAKGEEAVFGKIIVEGPAAVFTSGDYEQFAEINGKKYGHIIDPHTGYPASGLKSATVIDEKPGRAPGISAGIIAMGEKRAKEFVENKNIAAFLINESGEVYMSKKFSSIARFINDR